MSRNRSRGPGTVGEARRYTVAAGTQGGQAWGGRAPAVRGVALTKDQLKAVRRSKMDERAAEQRARPGTPFRGAPASQNRRKRA